MHLHSPEVESQQKNSGDIHHGCVHAEQRAKKIQCESGAFKKQMKQVSNRVACGCICLRVQIFGGTRRAVDCSLGSVVNDIAHEVHF